MSNDDNVSSLITLMEKHWNIMEPEKPSLVISVVGGAKNFKLDGRMRDTFSTGLIKVIGQILVKLIFPVHTSCVQVHFLFLK